MSRLLGPACLLAALILIVACDSMTDNGTSGIVNETRGIVIAVEGGLQDVDSFTVLSDGEEMMFDPAPGGDYAFPLSHLRDHIRSGEPVLVRWEMEGDRRVATFVADG